MLGRFLEFSIATPDIQASLNFYCKLGFSPAEVGEAWAHPYAVVSDGRLVIGLHQSPAFTSSLTFVKPDLLKHIARLEQLDIAFEFMRLGDEVFNEVGWLDPSGQLVRLVEARTFSPPKHTFGRGGALGYFIEIALPAPERGDSKRHWEQLGFVGMEDDDPLPHVGCTSDTLDLGLYDPVHIRVPTLRFEVDDYQAALTAIQAHGVTASARPSPSLGGLAGMLLVAPEGTPIIVTASASPN